MKKRTSQQQLLAFFTELYLPVTKKSSFNILKAISLFSVQKPANDSLFPSVLNASLSLDRKDKILSPTETRLEALGFLMGPVRVVIYVPRPNFKACHVLVWNGSYVAV